MQYIIIFFEGIITFISPCMLPMLPIYISYFAGQGEIDGKKSVALKNSIGFVLGFSIVFMLLGALSATLGMFVAQHSQAINIFFGIVLILFGLNYSGIFSIGFLNRQKRLNFKHKDSSFFKTILFGMVFSIGWTPCIGAFLGSALMLASQSGTALKGVLLLAVFSIGLGLPFILSALLIQQLKSTFDFIKRNYKIINLISGILLIILGILMILGYFGL